MKEQANPRIDLTSVPASTHSGPRPAPSGSFSEALGKVSQSYIRIPGGERRSVPANFVGANQIGLPQALASSHEAILQDLATSIVESSDDAIISKDLDGIITSWNWGAEQLFGYTADEVIGKPVTILIPAERQEEEPEILARIRRGERIGHYETVRRRKDGSFVDISLTVSPIYGSDGEIIGASKIARDITDRKRAEEKISLLAREAEHRARNVLATVQAVVHLSQADTPADLKAAIKGRIQALANVHTLFVESHWKGAQLHTLITQELAPYSQDGQTRLHFDGENLLLDPEVAQAIAMSLHELATNAAKYGSLSLPDGKVHTEAARLAEGKLFLRWTETGGPPVKQPERHGIGSRVMDAMLRGLSGEIRFDWRAEGLVCEITIPARG
ncbi:MAG: PAS domain S-box protein [Xanthobacteraceae bacterium]